MLEAALNARSDQVVMKEESMTSLNTPVQREATVQPLDKLLHPFHVQQAHTETQPVPLINQSVGFVLLDSSVLKVLSIQSPVTLATHVLWAHPNHLHVHLEPTVQQ